MVNLKNTNNNHNQSNTNSLKYIGYQDDKFKLMCPICNTYNEKIYYSPAEGLIRCDLITDCSRKKINNNNNNII